MLTGKSLTGQVAIVTGASRGIGKAVAQALAAEGATVIINYNGSAEAAEAVAADIRSCGGMAELRSAMLQILQRVKPCKGSNREIRQS